MSLCAKQRIHCYSIGKYVCEDAIGESCVVKHPLHHTTFNLIREMNIDDNHEEDTLQFFTPFPIDYPTNPLASLGSHLNSCPTYIEQL